MYWFLSAVILLVLSGITAVLLNKFSRLATLFAVTGTVVACCAGLWSVIPVLLGHGVLSLSMAWPIFYGSFSLEVDPLSAFFLLPIFILSALAAIYGSEYLKSWFGKKPIGLSWLFYTLLVASMAIVVVARNAVLFLVAWEIMSIASFFLVTFEDENPISRRAGLIYLVATHVGTAFLFVLFILLGQHNHSLDFQQFVILDKNLGSIVFIFAVIGFGTKAGFIPLHIWLPEAHPAAPSHVSALMSGVMIKVGIYGLLRVLTFLGTPLIWWGWCFIFIGLASGILGILFSLAQQDLKRLLAYSSVENIGIITLGLGLGLLGQSWGITLLTVLGYGGALMHVLNHAFFKGLLFLAAGSVAHACHTRNLECFGGLLKRMPSTGLGFLVGAIAIAGLPPLNGFIGEFLIYFGAFQGVELTPQRALPCLVVIGGLAMIGCLSAACFLRAFGTTFLGESRHDCSRTAIEVRWPMRIPVVILGIICLSIGFWFPLMIHPLNEVLNVVAKIPATSLSMEAGVAWQTISMIIMYCYIFFVVLLGLVLLRKHLLSHRKIRESGTWDCGYLQPSPRMQYTASSFAQPITGVFRLLLRSNRHLFMPSDIFPKQASLTIKTPDLFHKNFYVPIFEKLTRNLLRLRWFQHGRLQFYILYILITLLGLLVWKLR